MTELIYAWPGEGKYSGWKGAKTRFIRKSSDERIRVNIKTTLSQIEAPLSSANGLHACWFPFFFFFLPQSTSTGETLKMGFSHFSKWFPLHFCNLTRKFFFSDVFEIFVAHEIVACVSHVNHTMKRYSNKNVCIDVTFNSWSENTLQTKNEIFSRKTSNMNQMRLCAPDGVPPGLLGTWLWEQPQG